MFWLIDVGLQRPLTNASEMSLADHAVEYRQLSALVSEWA